MKKTNYVQIAYQSDEEKLKMYMKRPKKEIARREILKEVEATP